MTDLVISGIELMVFILGFSFFLSRWKRFLNPYIEQILASKKLIFLSVFLPVVLILILIFIHIGIFNSLKNTTLIITALLQATVVILLYLKKNRLKQRQFSKAMIYLILSAFVIGPTILVHEGIMYGSHDYEPQWHPVYNVFNNDNITYNITAETITSAYTLKGFFVNEPFFFSIRSGSYVRFNGEPIPRNSSVKVNIYFTNHVWNVETGEPFQNLTTYETIFNGDNTFFIKPLGNSWLLGCKWAGEKYFIMTIFVDGEKVGEMDKVHYLTIGTGTEKAQIDMARASIIFAIWIIFLTILKIVDPGINWIINEVPQLHLDKKEIKKNEKK